MWAIRSLSTLKPPLPALDWPKVGAQCRFDPLLTADGATKQRRTSPILSLQFDESKGMQYTESFYASILHS